MYESDEHARNTAPSIRDSLDPGTLRIKRNFFLITLLRTATFIRGINGHLC
jgi:hypothetical protein